MRNAIILANKRTGSTFLQECLNSHPDIKCYDEMFMTRRGIDKRRGQYLFSYKRRKEKFTAQQYIEWLFSHDGAISFRLMYPHLEKNNEVTNIIKKKKIPVIHLIRKNHFHKYISSQTKKQRKIKVNSNNMISAIKSSENRTQKFIKEFKNSTKYIEIYYEDMFGRTEGENGKVKKYGSFNVRSERLNYLTEEYSKKICNFMDVEYRELYSKVMKRNNWNIWKHITNEKEVKNTLKNHNMKDYI